ncbi:ankyrin repeat domain-containing protein [Candidatus Accumulibacter sp. ACC003]|uniref:ankyrin repeat domain-containing protein n=1 Tax=Candidatus Accumulibacter sp. ACC003 TaxID=2823334 RepID=UPI0025B87F4F|nr:ankyrin repeat domain-containing protein [Candidatus Accumulibacter sp. ACC003]
MRTLKLTNGDDLDHHEGARRFITVGVDRQASAPSNWNPGDNEQQFHRGRRISRMKTAAPRTALAAFAVLSLALSACSEQSGDHAAPAIAAVVAETPPAAVPLMIATSSGDLAKIRALLDAGDDVNLSDALGRTPLHIAAFYGHPKTTALLIARGAKLEARDRIGMTPLHAAVLSGGRREVEVLIERNADVHARTDAGQTPLHLSGATGQPKLSQYLIAQGADPQSKDHDGKTPLFYASRNGHPITTGVLQQYSKKD